MKKGFTLIEILVVITIIGVLATVGAGTYSTLTKNSLDARRKADLEEIRAALEMYKSNNGLYPDGIASGQSIPFQDPADDNIYLQKVPEDPRSSTRYQYNLDVSSDSYELGAYLENGTETPSCGMCGDNDCNYCLTPYGQK
jgi:general secretion pathway protein G